MELSMVYINLIKEVIRPQKTHHTFPPLCGLVYMVQETDMALKNKLAPIFIAENMMYKLTH